MGFLDFLGGAVKILVGGAVFLIGMLAAFNSMIQGETTIAAIFLVIAFVGGLYAQYERGQQSKRIK